MEIRYLKEFVLLADCLSFSLAAERAFVSQSSLSKHIQTLERELGTELFCRTSKAVALTEFGRLYLPYAQQLVKDYERSETLRTEYLKNREQTLVLGVMENLQIFGVHQYLIGFRSEHPEFQIKVVEATNDKLYAMFKNGELNIFTSTPDSKKLDHPFYQLFHGQMLACCPRTHPLAYYEAIPLTALCEESIILPPKDTRFFKMLQDTMQNIGKAFANAYSSGYEAALSFVQAGMGIALLPSEAVGEHPPEGVCVRPLLPALSYQCGIECREQHQLCTAEKAFVRYAMERKL